MARAYEYIDEIEINIMDMEEFGDASNEAYQQGFIQKVSEYNLSRAMSGLGISSTILGLAFLASTPVSIAAGVTGLITALPSSAEDTLRYLFHTGISDWRHVKTALIRGAYDNGKWVEPVYPEFTRIKIKCAFIEYPQYNIRFVTDTNIKAITAYKRANGGWVPGPGAI
ncbi:MAG: hypothetical protein ACTHY0_04025 [Mammaliicoccus vitulinus]